MMNADARLTAAIRRVRRALRRPVQAHIAANAEHAYLRSDRLCHHLYYARTRHPLDLLRALIRARLCENELPDMGGTELLHAPPPRLPWMVAEEQEPLPAELRHEIRAAHEEEIALALAGEWLVLGEAVRECGGALMPELTREMREFARRQWSGDVIVPGCLFALNIATQKRHFRPAMNIIRRECFIRTVILELLACPQTADPETLLQVSERLADCIARDMLLHYG